MHHSFSFSLTPPLPRRLASTAMEIIHIISSQPASLQQRAMLFGSDGHFMISGTCYAARWYPRPTIPKQTAVQANVETQPHKWCMVWHNFAACRRVD